MLWGPHLWPFEFHPEDHDTGQKSFLGNIGQFNGEEIIEVISVDYDGKDIPRLTGRPETRDFT